MDLIELGIDPARMRQKHPSAVPGVSQAPRNAGPPRDQGGLKGVLQQDREVEGASAHVIRNSPVAGPSLVGPLLVVLQDFVDECRRRVDVFDPGAHEKRDVRPWKNAPHFLQCRDRHDRVADPIGPANQNAMNRVGIEILHRVFLGQIHSWHGRPAPEGAASAVPWSLYMCQEIFSPPAPAGAGLEVAPVPRVRKERSPLAKLLRFLWSPGNLIAHFVELAFSPPSFIPGRHRWIDVNRPAHGNKRKRLKLAD